MLGFDRSQTGPRELALFAVGLGFAATLLALAGIVVDSPSIPTQAPDSLDLSSPAPFAAQTRHPRPQTVPETTPRVRPTAIVSGLIVGTTGLPIANGEVCLVDDSGVALGQSIRTTPDGRFHWTGPRVQGPFDIIVTAPGTRGTRQHVDRMDGDHVNVGSLLLIAPVDVIVRVLVGDKPQSGISIAIEEPHRNRAHTCEITDEDGEAVFLALDIPEASLVCHVGGTSWVRELELDSIKERLLRITCEIPFGDASASGVVVNCRLSGATVIAESLNPKLADWKLRAQTDQTGNFHFGGLLSETYVFHAKAGGKRGPDRSAHVPASTIELGLQAEGTVRGRVFGAGAGTVTLTVRGREEGTSTTSRELTCDGGESGLAFEIAGLSPGRYALEAISNGARVRSDPFDIGDDGSGANVDMTLAPNGGSVRGHVVESDGAPAAFARIVLDGGPAHSRLPISGASLSSKRFETQSDSSGYFTIAGVDPGEYRLDVYHANRPPHGRRVVVRGQGEEDAGTMRIFQGGFVRASVRLKDGRPVPRIRVAIRAKSTGFEQTFETNVTGFVESPPLAPGTYDVSVVEPPGSETVKDPATSQQIDVDDREIARASLIWRGRL